MLTAQITVEEFVFAPNVLVEEVEGGKYPSSGVRPAFLVLSRTTGAPVTQQLAVSLLNVFIFETDLMLPVQRIHVVLDLLEIFSGPSVDHLSNKKKNRR